MPSAHDDGIEIPVRRNGQLDPSWSTLTEANSGDAPTPTFFASLAEKSLPPQPPLPISPVSLPIPNRSRGRLWTLIIILILTLAAAIWFFGFSSALSREPLAAVRQSLAALETEPTYHLSGMVSVMSDQKMTLKGVFVADRQNATANQSRITFDLSGLSGGMLDNLDLPDHFDMETRRAAGDLYLRLPILSLLFGSDENKWLAFTESDLTQVWSTQQLVRLKETDYLKDLILSSTRVGTERLGETPTIHYRFLLDPKNVRQLLMLTDKTEQPTIDNVTIDWWADQRDYLPRRAQLSLLVTTNDSRYTVSLLSDFSDFGKPVLVEKPDSELVIRNNLWGLLGGEILGEQIFSDSTHYLNDSVRKGDLRTLQTALELYRYDLGHYPITEAGSAKTTDPSSSLDELVQKGYLAELPRDPLHPTYFYGYQSVDGTAYTLWSALENSKDTGGRLRDGYWVYEVMSDLSLGSSATDDQSL